MTTVTISLPNQIAAKVDSEAKKKGFTTRSAFIGDLLKEHFEAGNEANLQEFQPKDLEQIRTEFEKTGKYNQQFIDNLIEGLSESSVYEGKTTKS